ncbi:MAG TPA: hypothetical protein PKA64_11230 [Myxococcota bacterium]|nr:hypothetical protein [Myxococcota bacterium]
MPPGPSLSLRAELRLRPELRLLLIAQQSHLARVLEMSEAASDAWLAHQIKENPALKRMTGPPRGGESTGGGRGGGSEADTQQQGSWWKDTESVEEELLAQLRLESLGEEEQAAAEHIIGNLDRRGFLACSLEDIAEQIDVDVDVVEDAQVVVMERLEPEGCGARDISEYLEFKLGRLFPSDRKILRRIACEYFDELAEKNYKRIAKLENLEIDAVARYAAQIASVAPYPLQGHAEVDLQAHVQPSFSVVRQPDGSLKVELTEPVRARVVLNRQYEKETEAMEPGDQKREALRNIETAKAVLAQVDHRYSVLGRVADAAVRRQQAYFRDGAAALINLTMEDVAEEIGESRPNVSRAVKERRYLWEGEMRLLRDLFTHRGAGNRPSKNKLHAILHEIVAAEDPANPLSDSAIADELRRRGYREARRTIAKHRELAGIKPVHLRRRRPDVG